MTPEPQHPVRIQTLEAEAISGHIFTPAPLGTYQTMSTEGNRALTGGDPPEPKSGGSGLLGAPPKVFDGKRSEAKEFMRAYVRWWKLNKEKPAFSIPYKRVALCISYMRGPKVDDWTDEQQEAMDKDVDDGVVEEFEGHWEKFRKAFETSYTDLAEGINAEKELKELRMKEGDIDTYIATFKKLLRLGGYDETEHGAVSMFKKGLPQGLAIRIIQNSVPIPQTLEEWIKEARQQQLRYLQTQEFTRKGLSPQALALAKKLGVRSNQRRHPDAMDVDSGNITQNRPPFNRLTDAEREDLKSRGACFRCRKQGHMSRHCSLRQNGSAEYGRPAPTQSTRSGVTDPVEEPKKDVNSLLKEVQECLKDGENKQKFFDGLIDSDFV